MHTQTHAYYTIQSHTHTHTHTNTQTHTYTHTHTKYTHTTHKTQILTQIYRFKHVYVYTHIIKHAQACVFIFSFEKHSNLHHIVYTNTHKRTPHIYNIYDTTHTLINTQVHLQTHTHTRTHTLYAHTRMCMCERE